METQDRADRKLAIKEVEDGRHVIVFAGRVNPTTLIEQVEKDFMTATGSRKSRRRRIKRGEEISQKAKSATY